MIALLAAFALAFDPAVASPAPAPTSSTTASPSPTPTATPLPLEFSGEALDFESGYIVFSTGDALRVAQDAPVVDMHGAPLSVPIEPGDYADVKLDAQGIVTLVRVSDTPIPSGQPLADIPRRFVVQANGPFPDPDLIPPAHLYPISPLSPLERVTITVEAPPQTPFADDVYISTDTSGWNPQAVRMQRIDGRHFRVSMDVKPGSQFKYLFTRGSWQTVETDDAGLRRAPRSLFASGASALIVDASVRRWLDLP